MTSQKNVWIALVVVGIIAIGAYSFPSQSANVSQLVADAVSKAVNQLGSVTGPDDSFECKTSNGVQTCRKAASWKTASDIPCLIASPSATSTLVFASATFTTSSSTAVDIAFAHSTTTGTQTANLQTKLNHATLSSGVLGTLVASTTPIVGGAAVDDAVLIFKSGEALSFQMAGTPYAGSANWNGRCQAVFQVN